MIYEDNTVIHYLWILLHVVLCHAVVSLFILVDILCPIFVANFVDVTSIGLHRTRIVLALAYSQAEVSTVSGARLASSTLHW